MPQVELFLSTSSLVLLLAAIIAVAVSIFVYRRTIPPISSSRRYLLVAIRSVSLILLFLLLLDPIIRLVRHESKRPAIGVLIDDSKSMSLTDGRGNRADAVHKLLKSEALGRLSGVGKTKYYRFAGAVRELPNTDSLDFEGSSTDISKALQKIRENRESENLQAVVLISDGNYNLGENPLHNLGQYGIPIYTLGIGDTLDQKDVLISKAVTNEIVYAESRVPMDVTVKSSGYNGERVEVSVSEGGKTIAQQFVTLKEGTWEYPVKFTFEPTGEGTKRYTVSVSRLVDEVTTQNNSRAVFVKVLKSKMKVLLVAGSPSSDVAFVRRALNEDKNIDVTALIQKNTREFYESNFSTAVVANADCIVLVGFPLADSREDVVRTLQMTFEQQRKPALIVVSRNIDLTKLRSLDAALPVIIGQPRSDESSVFVQVAEAGQNHPVMTLNGSSGLWHSLPPIYRTGTVFQRKPESEALAFAKVREVVLNDPLIVSRKAAGMKSLAVLGYGIWRWKLLTQSGDGASDQFQSFISNAVRWLTTREEEKQIKVSTTKEAYRGGEAVEFVGQVYDKTYRPIETADVRVVVKRGTETYETILSPIGNGRYEARLDGLGKGDYDFTGTVSADGGRLGESKGKFSVGGLEVEFLETRMNKSLLEQIAYQSGGKYFDPANASQLADELGRNGKLKPKEITHSTEFEPLSLSVMLALLVLLFGTEWFLRKQSGLL